MSFGKTSPQETHDAEPERRKPEQMRAERELESTIPEYVRSPELLSADSSRLLIIDVQEKLLPLIQSGKRIVHNCRRLLDGAKVVGVPAYGTEQYPRGLGGTASPLASRLGPVAEKQCFSCGPALNWGHAAEISDDRDQVVVAGMETHVCVLQTVLDLIGSGFRIHVVADAVSSRSEFDWRVALDRMATAGATITTVESVLFEWCERAGTPEFKEIQKLILEG